MLALRQKDRARRPESISHHLQSLGSWIWDFKEDIKASWEVMLTKGPLEQNFRGKKTVRRPLVFWGPHLRFHIL